MEHIGKFRGFSTHFMVFRVLMSPAFLFKNRLYIKGRFETFNWLPVKYRFNQSINSKHCPSYLHEVFELACPNNLRTRNSYLKLICPFRKADMGQNALSFIGPSIWNKTPEVLKNTTALILSNIT